MQCAKFYISKMIELGEESLSELFFIKGIKNLQKKGKITYTQVSVDKFRNKI